MAPSTISALSKLATVEQCAQYDQVVAPHLPQLEKFYENFVYAASSLAQLQQFYVSTNPLVTAFVFSLALAPIFLVASEINRNYSQVDRFWSILPSIYAVHYAAWSHLASTPTEKNDLVALIAVIWSVRLTFNYWRRGGYNIGSEDYRWNIIKAQIHPAIFFVFNVTFISTIQSVSCVVVERQRPDLTILCRSSCSLSTCRPMSSSTPRASRVRVFRPSTWPLVEPCCSLLPSPLFRINSSGVSGAFFPCISQTNPGHDRLSRRKGALPEDSARAQGLHA